MKIEIFPEVNDETGQTVFAWFVMRDGQTLAGGYCDTAAGARSDARAWILMAIL